MRRDAKAARSDHMNVGGREFIFSGWERPESVEIGRNCHRRGCLLFLYHVFFVCCPRDEGLEFIGVGGESPLTEIKTTSKRCRCGSPQDHWCCSSTNDGEGSWNTKGKVKFLILCRITVLWSCLCLYTLHFLFLQKLILGPGAYTLCKCRPKKIPLQNEREGPNRLNM